MSETFIKAYKETMAVFELYGEKGLAAHSLYLRIKDWCDTPTLRTPTKRFGKSPQVYLRSVGEAIISLNELAKRTNSNKRTIKNLLNIILNAGFLELTKTKPLTLRLCDEYKHKTHPVCAENEVTGAENTQVKDKCEVTGAENTQVNLFAGAENTLHTGAENTLHTGAENTPVQYNKNEYNKNDLTKTIVKNAHERKIDECLHHVRDLATCFIRRRDIVEKEAKLFMSLRNNYELQNDLAQKYNVPLVKIQIEVERWFFELYFTQDWHENQQEFLDRFLRWIDNDIKEIDESIRYLIKIKGDTNALTDYLCHA